MKFIEVKKGYSIAVDKIEAIEKKDELNTKIHTALNRYDVGLPYNIVLNMLKDDEKFRKDFEAFYKQAQHFAG